MNDSNKKEIWELHPTVCHYTEFEVIEKIIKSKILRATNFQEHQKNNDESELLYSKQCLLNKTRNNNITDGLDSLYNARGFNIYLSCFSEYMSHHPGLTHDDGLLSMWRFYGQGCCIEFDTKMLWEHVLKRFPEEAILFDEVYYGKTDKYNKLIDKSLSSVEAMLNDPFNELNKQNIENFLEVTVLTKHPGFFEEKEIRLAICCFKKSVFKKYIDIPIDIKKIKKIILGPMKNSDKNHKILHDIIKSYNLDIEITKSDIPAILKKKKSKEFKSE